MNSQTDLVPASQSLPMAPSAPRLAGVDIQALIEKSIDSKSAVEVVKELRAMWQEDQKIAAEAAFDAALSALQAEMPVISKSKTVKDAGGNRLYDYCPLDVLLPQVRPLLQKFGFHFTLDTDVESKDGWVIAKCIVTHTQGAKRESTAKFPLGAGTRAMSTTQIYAAALTFASRRVFCNSFGIVTGGEDLDGQGEKPKPPGPSTLAAEASVKELATELWRTLGDICKGDKDWKRANEWLWREDILDAAANEAAPNLSPKRFREVIEDARKKL